MAEYIEIPGYPTIQRVDLICGGFPCQDVSCAGKRAGLSGARSGLWFEMLRSIRYLRPKYVIVENVPGLLSCGFGRVLGDLAASGYDAEWDCIPAVAFGAPHLRYRLFVVAYTDQFKHQSNPFEIERTPSTELPMADALGVGSTRAVSKRDYERRPKTQIGNGGYVTNSNSPGLQVARNTRKTKKSDFRIFTGATINRSSWWATEPDVGRVAHGVPSRVDRIKSLGNAVIPEEITWVAERIKLREAAANLRQNR